MPRPTERFSERVDNYIKYRPGYTPETVTHIADAAGLTPGAAIADIGSGTGILTRLLLDRHYTVYAVEPNGPMREAAEVSLQQYPDFHSVNGAAEATTLPDQSIDLITSATAFHWFDPLPTQAEFRRILKPGGHVALLWNIRRPDADDFSRAYEQLWAVQPDGDKKDMGEADFRTFFRRGQYTTRSFPLTQTFDEEGLVGRSLSSSMAPPPGSEAEKVFCAQIRALFAQHQVQGVVTITYETKIYLGTV